MTNRSALFLFASAALVGLLAPACGRSELNLDDPSASGESGAAADTGGGKSGNGGKGGKGGTASSAGGSPARGGSAGTRAATGGNAGSAGTGQPSGGGSPGKAGSANAAGRSGASTGGDAGASAAAGQGPEGGRSGTSGAGGRAGTSGASGRGGAPTAGAPNDCVSIGSASDGMAGEGGAGPGSKGVVCLDERTGSPTLWEDDFSTYRETITAAGYTLQRISTLIPLELADCTAVILNMPYDSSWSSDQIDAVASYVSAGGGALVNADAGSFGRLDNMNKLAGNWGVSFSTLEEQGSGAIVSGFVSHPVTAGVCSIGVDYYRQLTLPVGGIDLTTGPINVLGVIDGSSGSGNLVFLGDLSIWINPGGGPGRDHDITSLDNARLLENILAYITTPAAP